MMASELIERLEEEIEEHGDQRVTIDTRSVGDSIKVETKMSTLDDGRVVIGLDGHYGRGG